MTATKVKNDVNADMAFEKSLETFRDHIGSYGTFTKAEKETLRQFFDLSHEAQRLGVQADSIRQEVETFENQITSARRQYALLIQEGRVDDATSAVSTIPDLRERQETLKGQIPSIAGRLDELEQAVAAIDHSKFLTLAKQAADDAEKMRCRATSIFSKPGEVQRTIAESKKKIA